MKLIECPACKTSISDQALSCPACGQPSNKDNRPVLIEKTAKRWKLLDLIGSLFLALAIIVMIASIYLSINSGIIQSCWYAPGIIFGYAMISAGIGFKAVAQFGAWWKHR
jgi:hypothetical protein